MSTVILEPKLDKIVVEPDAQDNITDSGIVLVSKNVEMPIKGTVLAVGTGTEDEDMEVQVGDRVIFKKGVGSMWENEGKNYIFMRQSDVLAIIQSSSK